PIVRRRSPPPSPPWAAPIRAAVIALCGRVTVDESPAPTPPARGRTHVIRGGGASTSPRSDRRSARSRPVPDDRLPLHPRPLDVSRHHGRFQQRSVLARSA